jgi:hypothetical protein
MICFENELERKNTETVKVFSQKQVPNLHLKKETILKRSLSSILRECFGILNKALHTKI